MLNFPEGFLIGAATSSHQVEGNNHNDWSVWEKSEKRKKQLEKSGLLKKYGYENFISGKACDHYNRYEEDFDIAKSLGHNTHRFSIEWSRIEPEEGNFNQKEIEHYRDVIRALKSRGLEPFVTLWHFTFPVWIKNGWLNPRSIFYFSRYAEKIVSELGNNVKFWITINEPITYSNCMYLFEKWIHNERSIIKWIKQNRQMVEIHKEAYQKIKKINPYFQVGIAKNNCYYTRFVWWCPFEWGIAKLLRYLKNEWFLNSIKDYQDFIGLNYYFHFEINPLVFKTKIPNERKSDMGWEICPEGIYYLILDLKKYNKPIYITENGVADAKDEKRGKFIQDNLFQIERAIQDGADVRGYFHWSLLDNFEWAHGFYPKFGLIEADRKTMKRTVRQSANFVKSKIYKVESS